MASTYQKVLSGRRVSIPESFSRKHGISEGDIVILQEDNTGLRIIPAQVVRRTT